MMTGMERLLALSQGTPADRVPVFCLLLDQGAKDLGLPLREYYAHGEHVAEAQLRMRAKYGYDNLWSLFYVGKEAELLGCGEIAFAESGPPNVANFGIQTPEDIHRLQVPDDLTTHPAFAESRKCLEILRREAGGKYPICAYLTSSMTLPSMLMGMEPWLNLLLRGPTELRDELLTKCSDFFHKQLAAYRQAGVDVFVYSHPFGSTDFVPRKLFQELSLPWLERDLQGEGTQGMVYYCGGARMVPVLEAVLERTGIGTYYLSPLDDIAAAKQILAGRALCAGVINDILLIDWSPDEVRREVQRIFAAGLPGGKFLFGTLAIPYNIPEANIHAMLETAYECGRLAGEE